jgi:hypothetical protein
MTPDVHAAQNEIANPTYDNEPTEEQLRLPARMQLTLGAKFQPKKRLWRRMLSTKLDSWEV